MLGSGHFGTTVFLCATPTATAAAAASEPATVATTATAATPEPAAAAATAIRSSEPAAGDNLPGHWPHCSPEPPGIQF